MTPTESDHTMKIIRDAGGSPSNFVFSYENDVHLSIGVSGTHYCLPKGHQTTPVRDAVEIAVLRGGGFVTSEFFSNVMGEVCYNQVMTYYPTSRIFAVMAMCEEWAVKGIEIEIDPAEVRAMYDKHEEDEKEKREMTDE